MRNPKNTTNYFRVYLDLEFQGLADPSDIVLISALKQLGYEVLPPAGKQEHIREPRIKRLQEAHV